MDSEEDEKNTTRTYTCPSMMKLEFVLFDYLADDTCYALGEKLIQKRTTKHSSLIKRRALKHLWLHWVT